MSLKEKFQNIHFRSIAKGFIDWIGDLMHYLLFHWLLPKRLRLLTRKEIYTIIFKSDTPAGKRFDVWLLISIVINIIVMIVDSFAPIREGGIAMHIIIGVILWFFTIMFTFEYYLRIYCLQHPWKYVLSFYGIIDFLSIFPAYLSLFFPAAHTLTVVRLLRMLRIFRIFKMQRFLVEGRRLINSLRRSATKIGIFMLFVFIVAVILGSLLYAIEVDINPQITSIPRGIYWAVVTLTTVGYGDIAPVTPLGQFLSMVVMILGYSIIAVPTGIVAGETIAEHRKDYKDYDDDLSFSDNPNTNDIQKKSNDSALKTYKETFQTDKQNKKYKDPFDIHFSSSEDYEDEDFNHR